MGKGRFLNQKLGKRTDRKFDLLKSRLAAEQRRAQPNPDLPHAGKKGVSREARRRTPSQP